MHKPKVIKLFSLSRNNKVLSIRINGKNLFKDISVLPERIKLYSGYFTVEQGFDDYLYLTPEINAKVSELSLKDICANLDAFFLYNQIIGNLSKGVSYVSE